MGKLEKKLLKYWRFELKMEEITSEDELRTFLLGDFARLEVQAWDCQAGVGGCSNPVMINNVPLVPLFGDIPIYFNDRYWAIELKFSKLRCFWLTTRQMYGAYRNDIRLKDTESRVLLQGGGILVLVTEPSPISVGVESITAPLKDDCLKKLESFRELIKQNQIPYNVMIFTPRSFGELWEEILEYQKAILASRGAPGSVYRRLPIKKIREKFPSNSYSLRLEEILQGELVNLIINLLREESG